MSSFENHMVCVILGLLCVLYGPAIKCVTAGVLELYSSKGDEDSVVQQCEGEW